MSLNCHISHRGKRGPSSFGLSITYGVMDDRKVFFFEAGRRCPRGEGNFAFLTNKAEEIFKLVEFNLKLNNKASDGQGCVIQASSIATTSPISVRPQDGANSLENTRTFPVRPLIFANPCAGVTFY